jgi:hypothetical protein
MPISQGSWEGFDPDEVEMSWQFLVAYRGDQAQGHVLLSFRLPDGSRRSFDMDAAAARDMAAQLTRRRTQRISRSTPRCRDVLAKRWPRAEPGYRGNHPSRGRKPC